MKKVLSILVFAVLLALILTVSVCATSDPAETTAQTTEQTPAPVIPPVTEPDTQEQTEEEQSKTKFFNETILPLLTSAASSILGLIAISVPYLKKSAKFNKLHGIYLKQKEENETLQGLLNMTDISKFKDAVYQVLTEDVQKALANVKIDNDLVADMNAQMELIRAQIQSLISGATNAWAQSPSAVACLSTAPTESAVKKQAAYIASLEDYVKTAKGEEAEKILTELKGA
jgi:hypothetical protein